MPVTFSSFTAQHLIALGYASSEAKWICDFRTARLHEGLEYDTCHLPSSRHHGVESNGHTYNTFYYTKTITANIERVTWPIWSTKHVHMRLDDFYDVFLWDGFPIIGFKLMSYTFTSPNDTACLNKFRKKYHNALNITTKKILYRELVRELDCKSIEQYK